MKPIHLRQINKKSEYGLVIDWKFHSQNRWVCAQSPYLVRALIEEFDPIVISSQFMYEWHKKKLRYIISLEPGWAAPKIKYDKCQGHVIGVFVSDPHNKTNWFEEYIYNNSIDYVFSYYYYPFLYYFPHFDLERLIHVPWAMPDEFCVEPDSISYRCQRELHIFGASGGEGYETRQWCRQFPFVEDHSNSGVENKVMSDKEFFHWTRRFDAIIAAGSLDEKYRLVTPKYFEVAASGSLLFAQYCDDLELLGFRDDNCVIFDKHTFQDKAMDYMHDPIKYMDIRIAGCRLIQKRHKISDRVEMIRKLMTLHSH